MQGNTSVTPYDERDLDHQEKVSWQKLGYPSHLPEFRAFQSRTNGPNYGKWYVSTTRGWGPNTCWMDKPVPFGQVMTKDGKMLNKSDLKTYYKKNGDNDPNQYYFKGLEDRIMELETQVKKLMDLQFTTYVPPSPSQQSVREFIGLTQLEEEPMDQVNEPWPKLSFDKKEQPKPLQPLASPHPSRRIEANARPLTGQ